jgi:hypothetical protein
MTMQYLISWFFLRFTIWCESHYSSPLKEINLIYYRFSICFVFIVTSDFYFAVTYLAQKNNVDTSP